MARQVLTETLIQGRRKRVIDIIKAILFQLRQTFLLVLLLFIFSNKSYCQHFLKGTIQDSVHNPVANVNVLLRVTKNPVIAAYSVSDLSGKFTIPVPEGTDTAYIELTIIGFKKVELQIPASQIAIPRLIVLSKGTFQLPEVFVKAKSVPIVQNKDTLSFDVKSFIGKNDRVILDVLKKLPGLTVLSSGQIQYNGKPINKLYVEGQDLMDDRYNIITNNLPAGVVDKVQVLENHQPIKILDSLVYSDQAALNIKLQANAKSKLLGNGWFGMGASPFLTDDLISVMKFAKKIQYINSVRYNNTGIDLSNETSSLNAATIRNLVESNSIKEDILHLIKSAPPPVSESRQLFNHSLLLTTNINKRLNDKFEIKLNAGFQRDKISSNSFNKTQIVLPSDTISLDETHAGADLTHTAFTDITLISNSKKLYLNNTIKWQQVWQNATDNIVQPYLNQQVNNKFRHFQNDFHALGKIRKSIIGFSSFTSYTDYPQLLNFAPGLYDSLLNISQPIDGLIQMNQLKSIYSNNNVSWLLKIKQLSVQTNTGFLLQKQELTNGLNWYRGKTAGPVAGQFQNDFTKTNNKVFSAIKLLYEKRKFVAGINLQNDVYFQQLVADTGSLSRSKYFFNPQAFFIFNIDNLWKLNASVATNTNFGSVDEMRPGYLFETYRNITFNSLAWLDRNERSADISLNYKNSITAFFAGVSLTFSQTLSNFLFDTEFQNYLETKKIILQNNRSAQQGISVNLGKYYSEIKTTIKAKLGFTIAGSNEIRQGLRIKNESKILNAQSKINASISKYFSIEYGIDYSRYQNTLKADELVHYPPIVFLKQNFGIDFFAAHSFSIKMNVESFYNTYHSNTVQQGNSNYIFGDLSIQKDLFNKKTNIQLQANNIFNTKTYTSYSVADNNFIISGYTLRSRAIICKLNFQF